MSGGCLTSNRRGLHVALFKAAPINTQTHASCCTCIRLHHTAALVILLSEVEPVLPCTPLAFFIQFGCWSTPGYWYWDPRLIPLHYHGTWSVAWFIGVMHETPGSAMPQHLLHPGLPMHGCALPGCSGHHALRGTQVLGACQSAVIGCVAIGPSARTDILHVPYTASA